MSYIYRFKSKVVSKRERFFYELTASLIIGVPVYYSYANEGPGGVFIKVKELDVSTNTTVFLAFLAFLQVVVSFVGHYSPKHTDMTKKIWRRVYAIINRVGDGLLSLYRLAAGYALAACLTSIYYGVWPFKVDNIKNGLLFMFFSLLLVAFSVLLEKIGNDAKEKQIN